MKQDSNLVAKIFRLQRLLVERMKKGPDAARHSLTQLKTLRFIDEHNNPTMKGAADFLCVMPPTATAVVDRLIAEKLVRRVSDTADRRVVRLAITASGKRRLAKGFGELAKIMGGMLKSLSGEEQKKLGALLDKLIGRVA